jgi:hypothetical protein
MCPWTGQRLLMRDVAFRMIVLTLGPKALNAWSVYRVHPELPPNVLQDGDRFADSLRTWIAAVTKHA